MHRRLPKLLSAVEGASMDWTTPRRWAILTGGAMGGFGGSFIARHLPGIADNTLARVAVAGAITVLAVITAQACATLWERRCLAKSD